VVSHARITPWPIHWQAAKVLRVRKVYCGGRFIEYYKKRKNACIEEALEYARSIKDRFKRLPTIEDFHEEFVLFTDGYDIANHKQWMISQLGGDDNYKIWCKEHKAPYKNIDDFLDAALQ
jgi:hypothetical protein